MNINLVIAGGGVKAYSAIGALRMLEKTNTIVKVAGVSAGSIIASLIALGCDSFFIEKIYSKMDLSKYVLRYRNIMTYINILFKRGIHNSEEFKEKIIHKLLEEACNNGNITFKEAYEIYGKTLVISGTCINKMETHYYHYISNPCMKLKDAIVISCCVPFLFSPIEWKGDTLVDGGVIENYPLYFFNDNILPNSREHKVKEPDSHLPLDTIGIKFSNNYVYNETDTIVKFIKSIILTFLTNNEKKYIREDYLEKSIIIDVGDIDSIANFNLSEKDRQRLLDSGYKYTREYMMNLGK